MDTRSVRYTRFRLAALAVVFVAVLAGCGMPFEWSGKMPDSWGEAGGEEPGGEEPGHEEPVPGDHAESTPQIMKVSGPAFTLAWDPGAAQVDSYRIYWRGCGTSEWHVLASGAAEPQLTVNEGDLPYGRHEFAVSSVTNDGVESDLHHSFDENADPVPWILEWIAG